MSSSAAGEAYAAGSVDIAIQIRLNDILGPAAPVRKSQPIGTLQVLNSNENRSILQFEIDRGDGSRNEGTGTSRKVKYTYWQPVPEADISVGEKTTCVSDDEMKPCNDEAEITTPPITTKTYKIPEWEIRRLGEGEDVMLARQIALALPAFRRKINRVLATEMAGAVGQFEDGSTSKTYNILNSTEGSLRSQGVFELERDLMDAGFTGMPWIVGGGNWHIFKKFHEIGGLQDTGQLTNHPDVMRFGYRYDNMVSDAAILANANGAFAMEPGAVQLLNWVGNRGQYANVVPGVRTYSTLQDPVTGMFFDIYAKYEDCPTGTGARKGANWVWWMETSVQTWTMPSDAWSAGHDLENVNGLYKVIGAAV